MQQLKELLKFNGQWRSYQKRVLDESEQYLRDKRIHIVAAPGSGKTTLGIELIRRLNAPCLILSPSVNIRDQWLARIEEAYIPEGISKEGLLSNNIKVPGIITAITYQALHSGITRANAGAEKKNVGTEDFNQEAGTVDVDSENADYSDFDFFATVRKTGIKTICLDEAHHLRSEWWKALEEMVGKMPDCTVISLTATPPYDSTPAQWERYVGLCGPIDEEIIVPELVKEGSLCPHQDYVYFNMPTKEEEAAVKKFASEAVEKAGELFRDDELTGIISTHKGLAAPRESADLFLKNQEYLSSLLIFLQAKGIAFSPELLKMLGTGNRLPSMNLKWMEILLQGFLYEDTESYACTKEYREKLIASLKAHGLIQKNTVCLTANDAINKLLTNSKGKLNSILEVTRAEFENLKGDLRLLILTDYIKKEYMQAVGDLDKSVNELGVIPIFENIRRTFSGMKNEKNTSPTGERITVGDLR
ncbi:MAG: DEAD/DEAH box helicase, partial [Lachnospiraceae bacterium]